VAVGSAEVDGSGAISVDMGAATAPPVTASHTNYSCNSADELVSASSSGLAAAYAYNGDGLRTSKTVNGTTTQFTRDSSGSLPLLLSDGTADYLYGPDGLPLEQVALASGATYYYDHDQQGSTRLVTDASGTVAATYTYGPYGNLLGSTGTLAKPFGYAGAYADAETGLLYLVNRYYDPTTAQFVSVDPLVGITQSPYGYAGDDPVNNMDPSGLFCLGLCSVSNAWNDTGGKAVHYLDKHQRAFEVGAGVALGVAAAATGVGAVVDVGIAAGAEGAAAEAALSASSDLNIASLATGAGATALDGNGCIGDHDAVACLGLALGGTALVAGGAGELGTFGVMNDWITAETLPDAAFQGAGIFGAAFGIGGSIFDSIYGISRLFQGGNGCGS
jgi:RHS repeat-associated protein